MTIVQRKDEDIKLDVVSAMQWDQQVDAATVKVTVENGIVHLEGEVSEYSKRLSAVQDTMGVKGVRGVEDRLKVEFCGNIDIPGDEEIADSLNELICKSDDVAGVDILIKVKNGEVRLDGQVGTYLEKKKIEWLAGGIYGVREIVNNLIITPKEKVEDKIIATALNTFLESDKRIEPGSVEVWVEDGVVRLSGKVQDFSVYQATMDAVEITPGVRDIVDNIVVE